MSLLNVLNMADTKLVEKRERAPLCPGECWLLDAPGITAPGARLSKRFKEYIENGGHIIHRVRMDVDGNLTILAD